MFFFFAEREQKAPLASNTRGAWIIKAGSPCYGLEMR